MAIDPRGRVSQAAIEAMNDTMINNINAVVGKNDVLYNLGDFLFAKHYEYIQKCEEILDRIVCKNIHLIFGNHDNLGLLRNIRGFTTKFNYNEIEIDGKTICLFHYPIFPGAWNKGHHGSYQLFGHVHGALDGHREGEYNFIPPWSLQLDVGVDSHNFKPWHFEEVRTYMNSKLSSYNERDNYKKSTQKEWVKDGPS